MKTSMRLKELLGEIECCIKETENETFEKADDLGKNIYDSADALSMIKHIANSSSDFEFERDYLNTLYGKREALMQAIEIAKNIEAKA